MLSAFTARPIIELKARDRSKIETILAHGKHAASATPSTSCCMAPNRLLAQEIESSSA